MCIRDSINECNEIDWDSWQQLIFRTEGQIILDYNPSESNHWIYDKVETRDDAVFYKTTYKDNPFIDKNIIHFVDEIVIYSSNTDEMVDEIKDRYGSKVKIIVYPDPACRQRKTSAGGRTDLSILQNAGFKVKVKHKHPAIRDRVNSVNAKLKDSKGVRHIFVSKSCKTMIKGLQRQIYKENTNIPDKEQGFDHMNDALGYLIDFIKPLTSNMQFSKPTRWAIK